jgi:hypothetical protein
MKRVLDKKEGKRSNHLIRSIGVAFHCMHECLLCHTSSINAVMDRRLFFLSALFFLFLVLVTQIAGWLRWLAVRTPLLLFAPLGIRKRNEESPEISA